MVEKVNSTQIEWKLDELALDSPDTNASFLCVEAEQSHFTVAWSVVDVTVPYRRERRGSHDRSIKITLVGQKSRGDSFVCLLDASCIDD